MNKRFKLVRGGGGFVLRLVGRDPVIDLYIGPERLDDPTSTYSTFGPGDKHLFPNDLSVAGPSNDDVYLDGGVV